MFKNKAKKVKVKVNQTILAAVLTIMGGVLVVSTTASAETAISTHIKSEVQSKLEQKSNVQPLAKSVANNIEKEALKHLGTPYRWGGNTPNGFDTGGFTQYVFAQNGVKLPRTVRDQYKTTVSIEKSELRKGDLVFFEAKKGSNNVTHVGIYLNNDEFIAVNDKGVTLNNLSKNNWKTAFVGAKRVVVKEANKKPLVDYFVYLKGIPMSSAHQEFLFEKSKQLGLDYKKVLAVIMTESNFNPNKVSKTKDYGYFQINQYLHSNLADLTDTANKPLDGYVNMTWGTRLLSDAQEHWIEKGFKGSELDSLVWSSFSKGVLGVINTGVSKYYTYQVEKNLVKVERIINKEVK